jgi:hypothetical protein
LKASLISACFFFSSSMIALASFRSEISAGTSPRASFCFSRSASSCDVTPSRLALMAVSWRC